MWRLTEIRKNEARLCRVRILTVFQEGRTVLRRKTGSSPDPTNGKAGSFEPAFWCGLKVPEEKTVDNCFFEVVTEIKKNEARLCRERILTVFQEGRTVLRRKTGLSPDPHKRKSRFFRTCLLVRVKGLEPSQPCDHKNLNLTRLPIPPNPHMKFPLAFASNRKYIMNLRICQEVFVFFFPRKNFH